MSAVTSTAAAVGSLPYQREIDQREADLVGRYAADLGLTIYAWNGAMSAAFLLFLSESLKAEADPALVWGDMRSDRCRLEKLIAMLKKGSAPDEIKSEVVWTLVVLISALEYRNAIVHLGLCYAAGDVAADPYGPANKSAIVAGFLSKPGDLTTLFADLRVLTQYLEDLGIRAMYPDSIAPEHQKPRPQLLFLRTL